VFTPHFDPNHCFAEAKKLDIEVHGAWFPRSVKGKFIAACAYIRMFICSLWVLFFGGGYDYYILD
jgi:alpha-1,3/alpha-1,6-mannosyltransferase